MTRKTALVLFVLFTFLSAATAEDAAAGKLFAAKCAMCHGSDGLGKTGIGKKLQIPQLPAPEIQSLSDADLGAVINKGKGKMPSFEGKLSQEEVSQVLLYIRGLAKTQKAAN